MQMRQINNSTESHGIRPEAFGFNALNNFSAGPPGQHDRSSAVIPLQHLAAPPGMGQPRVVYLTPPPRAEYSLYAPPALTSWGGR